MTHDFADAMLRAVQLHASSIRESGDLVDFNAWWRGGDHLKARLYLRSAMVYDIKEGTKYNTKDFARIACGTTLPEFLKRFGSVGAPAKPKPSRANATPHEEWRHDAADRAWSRLPKDQALCKWWLEDVRGLFPIARAVEHIRAVHVADAEPVLALMGNNARDALTRHPLIVVLPMRHPVTGKVANLNVRGVGGPPSEGPKAFNMVATPLSGTDNAPLVYGVAAAQAAHCRRVFLVEGGPDTLALESLGPGGPPSQAVVGAHAASALPKVAAWLATAAPNATVVIFPHLDGGGAGVGTGEREALKADGILGRQGHVLRFWKNTTWAMDPDCSDLADVTKAARARGMAPHTTLAALVGNPT